MIRWMTNKILGLKESVWRKQADERDSKGRPIGHVDVIVRGPRCRILEDTEKYLKDHGWYECGVEEGVC